MNLPESSTEHPDVARLRDELDAVVRTLDVPTDRLTATARSQGRVVRRRRRLGTGVAALATLIVIGIGAGQVLGSNGAAPDSATDTSPDSTPPVDGLKPASGWWSMPVVEMENRLRALLPADVTLTDVALEPMDPAPGTEDSEVEGYLHAVVESPTSGGPGEIEIFLKAPMAAYPEPADPKTADSKTAESKTTNAGANTTRSGSAVPSSNDFEISCGVVDTVACTRLRQADGTVYGIYYTADSQGSEYVGSHVLTEDDGLVKVMVSDDSSGATWSAPVTADRPALTVEQVRAIAEDPTWQDWTHQADD